jgi:hypothetical protein
MVFFLKAFFVIYVSQVDIYISLKIVAFQYSNALTPKTLTPWRDLNQ